jgi:hypothetical protein
MTLPSNRAWAKQAALHPSVTRRSFLDAIRRSGTGLMLTALLPSGRLAAQEVLSKDRLIVRAVRPQDLETPAHLLTSWITPNDLF